MRRARCSVVEEIWRAWAGLWEMEGCRWWFVAVLANAGDRQACSEEVPLISRSVVGYGYRVL